MQTRSRREEGERTPGLGRDDQITSGIAFPARLVAHIALGYECRIQTYGSLSTTNRRQFGWVDRQGQGTGAPTTDLLRAEESSEAARLRRETRAHRVAKVWRVDPEICASYGERLRVVSAIQYLHQDDGIQSILRNHPQKPSSETKGSWTLPGAERGEHVTLTAPGCGMGDVPRLDTEIKIRSLPARSITDVNLRVDPPWSAVLMGDAGHLQLGMF